MLIVFDLDDTLIETSRDLFFKTYQHLFATLQLDEFPRFLQINETSLSAKIALKKFFSEKDLPTPLFESAVEILKNPLPANWTVRPTSNAIPLLRDLSSVHTIVLVSVGIKSRQLEKMEKAGIQNHMFSTISCVDTPDKKGDVYASLLQKYACTPRNSLVCGDRVMYDLIPAAHLGMTTVHFPHGRGSKLPYDGFSPDFTIKNLLSLHSVIKRICYG